MGAVRDADRWTAVEAGVNGRPAWMTGAQVRAWLRGRYGPDLEWLFEDGLRAWDGWEPARRHCFLLAAERALRRPRARRAGPA